MFEQETALHGRSGPVPTTSEIRLPGRGAMRPQLGQIGLAQPAVRPAPRVLSHDLGSEPPSAALAFFLFILVNAVLLIRPAEIIPELRGIELYFYVIGACSLAASGDVLRYLIGRPLST